MNAYAVGTIGDVRRVKASHPMNAVRRAYGWKRRITRTRETLFSGHTIHKPETVFYEYAVEGIGTVRVFLLERGQK